MQDIAKLLEGKYKYHVRYSRAVVVLQKEWEDLCGDISQHIWPASIYKNKLVLACNNPIWASEIAYFKDKILEKVMGLFIKKRVRVKIIDITIFLNTKAPFRISKNESNKDILVSKDLKERIQWDCKKKKLDGQILCQKCQKMFSSHSICRLCQLTGS